MGQLLAAQPKNPGAKGRGPIAVVELDRNDPPTLAAQGITKDESSAYQRLAAVPDPVFEAAVTAEEERARDQGGTNVTRAGVLRRVGALDTAGP